MTFHPARRSGSRYRGVTAIPRARSPVHVRENADALRIKLSASDLADIDRAFPPPARPTPLEMI
jgi:diketogulonate reductase-like aldo/keto reductase